MTSILEERSPGTPREVRCWRLQELERAGYPSFDAEVLASRTDVDLHVAIALLSGGCPIETALRILL